jgi:hypothetical protein
MTMQLVLPAESFELHASHRLGSESVTQSTISPSSISTCRRTLVNESIPEQSADPILPVRATPTKKDLAFALLFFSLCVSSFLSAMDLVRMLLLGAAVNSELNALPDGRLDRLADDCAGPRWGRPGHIRMGWIGVRALWDSNPSLDRRTRSNFRAEINVRACWSWASHTNSLRQFDPQSGALWRWKHDMWSGEEYTDASHRPQCVSIFPQQIKHTSLKLSLRSHTGSR